MLPRRLLLRLAAACATASAIAWPLAAPAQAFPERGLKLVVGFPPGTGPDIVARALGQQLGQALGQAVVVDNRAGAGGQIAAQGVARSPADGYSLLLGEVGSISIAPAAYSKLPYDPARELVAISEVVRADFVLVVPANAPAKDLAGFVEAARANADRVNFATFGAGTPGHFGAEILAAEAGFKVEPVHYRSTGDAIVALVAGDVGAAFVSTALAAPQIKAGKLRGLATTAPQRAALLPEVPTFAESGRPTIDFSAWFALFAPAGTPPAVLDQLSAKAVEAAGSAELRRTLQDAGFVVLGSPRVEAARMVETETQRWAAIVRRTGFKAD